MTPRERWKAVLAGNRPDRVPCDYQATIEVTKTLQAELGCVSERALWERLGIDACVKLAPIHPQAKEDDCHIQLLFSVWHVGTRSVTYAGGQGVYLEAVSHPLANAQSIRDVELFDWPDPNAWDVTMLRARCMEWQGYPIVGGCFEPFYIYCRLRGMEQAFTDLGQNPTIIEAALERIYYIHEAIIRRSLSAATGLIDLVYVAEDLGMQNSLLMSATTFRRFLKPWLARMIDLVHSYGVKAFHHDDGAIRPLLPELIGMGIDILDPIQWRCPGVEREGLARDFGAALVFHGGVDNQQTLPFGTPDDVHRESTYRIIARTAVVPLDGFIYEIPLP